MKPSTERKDDEPRADSSDSGRYSRPEIVAELQLSVSVVRLIEGKALAEVGRQLLLHYGATLPDVLPSDELTAAALRWLRT